MDLLGRRAQLHRRPELHARAGQPAPRRWILPARPLRVRGDYTRICQVFGNLLSNAGEVHERRRNDARFRASRCADE